MSGAYLLGGGSNGGDPGAIPPVPPGPGSMSNEWDLLTGGWWGAERYFNRAVELGASSIHLQLPYGVFSHPFDVADTIRSHAHPLLRHLVRTFAEFWGHFRKTGGVPVIAYLGDIRNPTLPTDGREWLRVVNESVAPVIDAGVELGLDGSNGIIEDSLPGLWWKTQAKAGVRLHVEGYWHVDHSWLTAWPCIVTDSTWRNKSYPFASNSAGMRVSRVNSDDSELRTGGKVDEGKLRAWIGECAASEHEAMVPAHLFVKQGIRID